MPHIPPPPFPPPPPPPPSFLSTPLTHTHTMHTLAVKPKRLNQPMIGPSLYRKPSYTMYIALVFAASPDVLGYHASETIGFTSAFALLAPARFQNHWFSYRFSIVCTHMLPKTLPVPDFNNFLNKKLTTPLVLPNFPDRFCKKPNKTSGFTRFSRFLKLFQGYTAHISLYGLVVWF